MTFAAAAWADVAGRMTGSVNAARTPAHAERRRRDRWHARRQAWEVVVDDEDEELMFCSRLDLVPIHTMMKLPDSAVAISIPDIRRPKDRVQYAGFTSLASAHR